jgi:23S rRNA pseudouridine1911/1915/1917 synthase
MNTPSDAAPEPVVVPGTLAGERLDRAVALLTGWSRADVADLVEREQVLVNGRAVAKSRRLVEGEVVELLGEPTPVGLPQPEAMPLVVVHEDPDVVVIDKPAGLVVHAGAGHPDGTLVNGLLARYPEIATVGDPARPGIVHRLDAHTSGLLVVARSAAAYDALVAALGARIVDRGYRALVWGIPDATSGLVDAPIGRSVRRPPRMAVREGGRPARTRYEIEQPFPAAGVSLLRCRLETGRTHQIRVHLSAIGHPVVGDAAYGGIRAAITLDRPFLHAASLGFEHPTTGEALAFTSDLPPELTDVLARL